MQNIAQMYYLFSKCELFEAVYICDGGKYIDAATLQTGVYPMGSILSKAVGILTPLLKRNHDPFLYEDEVLEEFSRFSVQSSSFSSSVSDDASAQTVLRLLLVDRQYIAPDEEKFSQLFELLKSYAGYIDLCQSNKKFCSFDKLSLLVKQNGNILPHRSIYTAKNSGHVKALSKSEIKKLLEQDQSPERFDEFAPALKKQRTTFGGLYLPPTEIKITKRKERELRLKRPIYIFDIHDIVDLILASLQCIFESGYIVKKCSHCDDLFVIRRGNQKYCPIPTSASESKSCYQVAKEQRQMKMEASGSAHMHKSLRTMYATKFGVCSDEYNNLMRESQNWRDKVKSGEATEEEYVAWLKPHFKRKYRKKDTAAET